VSSLPLSVCVFVCAGLVFIEPGLDLGFVTEEHESCDWNVFLFPELVSLPIKLCELACERIGREKKRIMFHEFGLD
jgi:hypothetical protein